MYTNRLYLTRVNVDNSDSRGNKLLSQSIGKGPDGSLGGTVDTATGVCLTASDTSNVDNISPATIASLLEDGQDFLGHVDQTVDVGVEHSVDILRVDFWGLGNTLDQATTHCQYLTYRTIIDSKRHSRVVDQDVNLLELYWKTRNEALDFRRVANIQLDGQHFNAIANLLLYLLGKLVQRVDPSCRHDKFQVLGRSAGELLGSASTNSCRSSGHHDRLAFKALSHCCCHCASGDVRLDCKMERVLPERWSVCGESPTRSGGRRELS